MNKTNITQPPAVADNAGQAAHTPTLCLIGSPNSGLAIHAQMPGGQSDQLARIVIKDPASAQAFGNRVVRACNSHAALVEALERVMPVLVCNVERAESAAERAEGSQFEKSANDYAEQIRSELAQARAVLQLAKE